MALFKIFKGKSQDLKEVGHTEGYAYFTPDDGKFYIDVKEKGEIIEEPVIGTYYGEMIDGKKANRICINSTTFKYDDFNILDCGTSEDFDVTIFDCNV